MERILLQTVLPTTPVAPREEVLRYLGYRPHQSLAESEPLLKQAQEELLRAASPKGIALRLPCVHTPEGVQVAGLLLPGVDLVAHLAGAKECILFAATLGPQVERRLQYAGATSLALQVVMDATATATIEAYCDAAEEHLRRLAEQEGLALTWRFSPGYGDLPLTVQGDFLRLLDAPRQIGLTATAEHILIPRKSVTAIMGLALPTAQSNGPNGFIEGKKGCAGCPNAANCNYRKEGKLCEF